LKRYVHIVYDNVNVDLQSMNESFGVFVVLRQKAQRQHGHWMVTPTSVETVEQSTSLLQSTTL